MTAPPVLQQPRRGRNPHPRRDSEALAAAKAGSSGADPAALEVPAPAAARGRRSVDGLGPDSIAAALALILPARRVRGEDHIDPVREAAE
jgi:hypothetical protein